MHGGVLGHVDADLVHNFLMQMQGDHNSMQIDQMRHDDSLMQVDQLHVENSFELVRYFEKLVEDEVSACNLPFRSPESKESKFRTSEASNPGPSAPFLSDSNLMHSDQSDTGQTLKIV